MLEKDVKKRIRIEELLVMNLFVKKQKESDDKISALEVELKSLKIQITDLNEKLTLSIANEENVKKENDRLKAEVSNLKDQLSDISKKVVEADNNVTLSTSSSHNDTSTHQELIKDLSLLPIHISNPSKITIKENQITFVYAGHSYETAVVGPVLEHVCFH